MHSETSVRFCCHFVAVHPAY